jgi:hypothetical protein
MSLKTRNQFLSVILEMNSFSLLLRFLDFSCLFYKTVWLTKVCEMILFIHTLMLKWKIAISLAFLEEV